MNPIGKPVELGKGKNNKQKQKGPVTSSKPTNKNGLVNI